MQVNEQGKQVIAGRMRFQAIDKLPVTETTSTVAPIDPMTMVIAAALFSIDQKLSVLQKKTEEILQFLKLEKQTRQRGNLNMLTEILEEYKADCSNEKMSSLRAIAVQSIKKEAHQDILFYQERISQVVQEQQKLHGVQKSQEMLESVSAEFYEYQLACYMYGFSSFLEVMLQKDFSSSHLQATSKKMQDCAARYNALYRECRTQLANYQRSAIETKLLGGLGSVVKTAGEKLANVPVLSKGPVDEALIGAGESLGKFNRDTVAKRMEQFEPLEEERLSTFVENVNLLDVICNQEDGLMTDCESLYMLLAV